MTMQVSIDREKCCGYGICAEICPSVYKLDDQGFIYLDSAVVPDGDEAAAVDGADACPEAAITVLAG